MKGRERERMPGETYLGVVLGMLKDKEDGNGIGNQGSSSGNTPPNSADYDIGRKMEGEEGRSNKESMIAYQRA